MATAPSIPLQGPPISSAVQYLAAATSVGPATDAHEPELLKAIRVALRGSSADLGSTIHSTYSSLPEEPSRHEREYNGRANPRDVVELTWNAQTVVMSVGGVIRKKWDFEGEGQSIQWACIGWLEQNASISTSSSTRRTSPSDESSSTYSPDSASRPTFGPFTRAQQQRKVEEETNTRVLAVFVFLRSIGKIHLLNGLEYTFSLPFIVRRAWAIYPHGVMVQRVLEAAELEESGITGDPVLPTMFSVTSPFSEAEAVGLTDGIMGGFHDSPASLKDEEENSTKPLKSVPPTEIVVGISHRGAETQNDVLVTLDVENRQLSLWRYAYVKPQDVLIPRGDGRSRAMNRNRISSSAVGGSRRHSAVFSESSDRQERHHPLSPNIRSREHSPTPVVDAPPLAALPGMAPSLSTTTTMDALVAGKLASPSQWSHPVKGRRNSLTHNDLSLTMDRMALGGRLESDGTMAPVEYGRMRAAYWIEKLHSEEVSDADAESWRQISVSFFDHRWDGQVERSLTAICLPSSKTLRIFSVAHDKKLNMLKVSNLAQLPAVAAAPLLATRDNVWDLLLVKEDGQLSILTHGIRELPIHLQPPPEDDDLVMHSDGNHHLRRVVLLENAIFNTVTLHFDGQLTSRTTIDLIPRDVLTRQCLEILARTIPADLSFDLHRTFIQLWSLAGLHNSDRVEFECFSLALFRTLNLEELSEQWNPARARSWDTLSTSPSHDRFCEDPTLRLLRTPKGISLPSLRPKQKLHGMVAPTLFALHTLGESLRLAIRRQECLLKLVPVICKIALVIRPEWADYWKRLCPTTTSVWPSQASVAMQHLDDRIPVWPPDISAILYGTISNPEWKVPWYDTEYLAKSFGITPSLEYGHRNPLTHLTHLTNLYTHMGRTDSAGIQERAEHIIHLLSVGPLGINFIDTLPLGVSAPLREEQRTCQLSPPGHWPLSAYQAVGRNDLAACARGAPSLLYNDGYRGMKEFMNPPGGRKSISDVVVKAKASGAGEVDAHSGIELDLEDFTDIRFGQDRRLEEVARMLCSSSIPLVKILERPDLNEHDQAKEQQHQVIKIAERTLALPFGRAMFTFGSVPTVKREAYSIPKLEFTIRMQPMNITAAPDPGKIPQDCLNWGEFHNGVAAGLRISPSSTGVESSWIAFNKPSELTPGHAGFLFGLGLTGHLKEMLTWHTFGYLTPKHDLTSIAVLLGLSAANVGSGDRHVTKLLAVHTPALLPTPGVDLNVSLMTQAAGLAGVGLLYMGTKNRRMAEVCLNQISRRDLVQPDLSNEHREAYTYSAALAFGMIMLGKGSSVPADMALLSRLGSLVHGDANSLLGRKTRPPFDINLTSPAATIALGLMYLRTERQDIADVLTIPDTVMALNRIQPSFLLMRTLARSLIMWNMVSPSNRWLLDQVPPTVAKAMEARSQGKSVDDALELAYYNILAGCCFVIGLKYAGTALQEAYLLIIRYFDLFSRLVYSNSSAFDHKIKRSAVREGLNLISISLSMVMAGTGEITCFRRLRYAYGMYHQAFRYGIHVATHMSLGLLFLGGGRFTLGTSDAAIASMVTAFFPRFHHLSSDNKSYLQALRHLWVLAVEPRCLIARDVDTGEVVYLPVKITIKEGDEVGTTQLISPTLIPDLDKLMSVRVDTPRYWPFYLDIEHLPRHKEALLRSQTLYVKRRTAFLSYTEDPRGCRSLFVRSGSSAGDAATLDFPQLTDTKTHPAGDLSQFITSFSNDVLFLAFADHFSREDGETPGEKLFQTYCHASLLDSILQDKPQTIQAHLTFYRYRTMPVTSRYFHLRLQDLRFAVDFYSKIYERRYSGRSENNPRPSLIRETTVSGALHALDEQLDLIRLRPDIVTAIQRYARGDGVDDAASGDPNISAHLAWYLIRNGVPVSTLLVILRGLARDAHIQCLDLPYPDGTTDGAALDQGIKEVLHGTGTKMTTALGSGWSVRSLEEVIEAWKVDVAV